MNPGRFYMPRMGTGIGPMMGANYLPTRGGVGLFGKIASSLRSFNWSGLLNGANKTLNVVNQTIPLVRQAGPMLNNMKSMLRIAKAFGSETNSKTNLNNRHNTHSSTNNITKTNMALNAKDKETNATIKNEIIDDNYPNFFI